MWATDSDVNWLPECWNEHHENTVEGPRAPVLAVGGQQHGARALADPRPFIAATAGASIVR